MSGALGASSTEEAAATTSYVRLEQPTSAVTTSSTNASPAAALIHVTAAPASDKRRSGDRMRTRVTAALAAIRMQREAASTATHASSQTAAQLASQAVPTVASSAGDASSEGTASGWFSFSFSQGVSYIWMALYVPLLFTGAFLFRQPLFIVWLLGTVLFPERSYLEAAAMAAATAPHPVMVNAPRLSPLLPRRLLLIAALITSALFVFVWIFVASVYAFDDASRERDLETTTGLAVFNAFGFWDPIRQTSRNVLALLPHLGMIVLAGFYFWFIDRRVLPIPDRNRSQDLCTELAGGFVNIRFAFTTLVAAFAQPSLLTLPFVVFHYVTLGSHALSRKRKVKWQLRLATSLAAWIYGSVLVCAQLAMQNQAVPESAQFTVVGLSHWVSVTLAIQTVGSLRGFIATLAVLETARSGRSMCGGLRWLTEEELRSLTAKPREAKVRKSTRGKRRWQDVLIDSMRNAYPFLLLPAMVFVATAFRNACTLMIIAVTIIGLVAPLRTFVTSLPYFFVVQGVLVLASCAALVSQDATAMRMVLLSPLDVNETGDAGEAAYDNLALLVCTAVAAMWISAFAVSRTAPAIRRRVAVLSLSKRTIALEAAIDSIEPNMITQLASQFRMLASPLTKTIMRSNFAAAVTGQAGYTMSEEELNDIWNAMECGRTSATTEDPAALAAESTRILAHPGVLGDVAQGSGGIVTVTGTDSTAAADGNEEPSDGSASSTSDDEAMPPGDAGAAAATKGRASSVPGRVSPQASNLPPPAPGATSTRDSVISNVDPARQTRRRSDRASLLNPSLAQSSFAVSTAQWLLDAEQRGSEGSEDVVRTVAGQFGAAYSLAAAMSLADYSGGGGTVLSAAMPVSIISGMRFSDYLILHHEVAKVRMHDRSIVVAAMSLIGQLFEHNTKSLSLLAMFFAGTLSARIDALRFLFVIMVIVFLCVERARRNYWPAMLAYTSFYILVSYSFNVLYYSDSGAPKYVGATPLSVLGLRVSGSVVQLWANFVLLALGAAEMRLFSQAGSVVTVARVLRRVAWDKVTQTRGARQSKLRGSLFITGACFFFVIFVERRNMLVALLVAFVVVALVVGKYSFAASKYVWGVFAGYSVGALLLEALYQFPEVESWAQAVLVNQLGCRVNVVDCASDLGLNNHISRGSSLTSALVPWFIASISSVDQFVSRLRYASAVSQSDERAIEDVPPSRRFAYDPLTTPKPMQLLMQSMRFAATALNGVTYVVARHMVKVVWCVLFAAGTQTTLLNGRRYYSVANLVYFFLFALDRRGMTCIAYSMTHVAFAYVYPLFFIPVIPNFDEEYETFFGVSKKREASVSLAAPAAVFVVCLVYYVTKQRKPLSVRLAKLANRLPSIASATRRKVPSPMREGSDAKELSELSRPLLTAHDGGSDSTDVRGGLIVTEALRGDHRPDSATEHSAATLAERAPTSQQPPATQVEGGPPAAPQDPPAAAVALPPAVPAEAASIHTEGRWDSVANMRGASRDAALSAVTVESRVTPATAAAGQSTMIRIGDRGTSIDDMDKKETGGWRDRVPFFKLEGTLMKPNSMLQHILQIVHFVRHRLFVVMAFEFVMLTLLVAFAVTSSRINSLVFLIAFSWLWGIGQHAASRRRNGALAPSIFVTVLFMTQSVFLVGMPPSAGAGGPFRDCRTGAAGWWLYLGCDAPVLDLACYFCAIYAIRMLRISAEETVIRRVPSYGGFFTLGPYLQERRERIAACRRFDPNADPIDRLLPQLDHDVIQAPRTVMELAVSLMVVLFPPAPIAFFFGAISTSVISVICMLLGLCMIVYAKEIYWNFYVLWPRFCIFFIFTLYVQVASNLPPVASWAYRYPNTALSLGVAPYSAQFATRFDAVMGIVLVWSALLQHRVFSEFFFAGKLATMFHGSVVAQNRHDELIHYMTERSAVETERALEKERELSVKLESIRMSRMHALVARSKAISPISEEGGRTETAALTLSVPRAVERRGAGSGAAHRPSFATASFAAPPNASFFHFPPPAVSPAAASALPLPPPRAVVSPTSPTAGGDVGQQSRELSPSQVDPGDAAAANAATKKVTEEPTNKNPKDEEASVPLAERWRRLSEKVSNFVIRTMLTYIEWLSIHTYTGAQPPADYGTTSRFLLALFNFGIRRTGELCIFVFTINFVVSGTIADMLLCVSGICYAMVILPWPEETYWDKALLYTVFGIALKSALKVVAEQANLSVGSKQALSVCFLDLGITTGSSVSNAAFIDILFDFFVFGSILIHKQVAVNNGVYTSAGEQEERKRAQGEQTTAAAKEGMAEIGVPQPAAATSLDEKPASGAAAASTTGDAGVIHADGGRTFPGEHDDRSHLGRNDGRNDDRLVNGAADWDLASPASATAGDDFVVVPLVPEFEGASQPATAVDGHRGSELQSEVTETLPIRATACDRSGLVTIVPPPVAVPGDSTSVQRPLPTARKGSRHTGSQRSTLEVLEASLLVIRDVLRLFSAWAVSASESVRSALGLSLDNFQGKAKFVTGNVKQRSGSGMDLYTWYLAVEFLSLVYFLSYYYSLAGRATGNFIDSVRQDLLPGTLVLGMLIMVLVMIADRVVYIQSSIVAKYGIHCALCLAYHIAFVYWRANVASSNTLPGVWLLLIKTVYFYVCAFQVRLGFASHRQHDPFTKDVDLLHWLGNILYRSIPFLFELRVMLDWTAARTTLKLNAWWTIEDIHRKLYDRFADIADTRYTNPRRGMYYSVLVRLYTGVLGVAGVVIILFFPLMYYSTFNPNLQPNRIDALSLQVDFTPYSSVFASTVIQDDESAETMPANVPPGGNGTDADAAAAAILSTVSSDAMMGTFLINSRPIAKSQEMGDRNKRVQLLQMPQCSAQPWVVSPPSRTLILATLRQAIQRNSTAGAVATISSSSASGGGSSFSSGSQPGAGAFRMDLAIALSRLGAIAGSGVDFTLRASYFLSDLSARQLYNAIVGRQVFNVTNTSNDVGPPTVPYSTIAPNATSAGAPNASSTSMPSANSTTSAPATTNSTMAPQNATNASSVPVATPAPSAAPAGPSFPVVDLPRFYNPFVLNRPSSVGLLVAGSRATDGLLTDCQLQLRTTDSEGNPATPSVNDTTGGGGDGGSQQLFTTWCFECAPLFSGGQHPVDNATLYPDYDCLVGDCNNPVNYQAQSIPVGGTTGRATDVGPYFVAVSEPVPKDSNFLPNVGIVALYTTFILTLWSIIRRSVTGMADRIIMSEIADPRPVADVVSKIYLTRSVGGELDLELEEVLFLELLDLLREPANLFRTTGRRVDDYSDEGVFVPSDKVNL